MKELVVTLPSLDRINDYIECGVNAIIIGTSPYASRLPMNCDFEVIEKIIKQVNKQMKIYVDMNNLIEESMIDDLKAYLLKLNHLDVDAIIFQDLAIMNIVQDEQLNLNLHYNPETLNTNYATLNFLKTKGIKRASLAREISLEDMKEIAMNAHLEIEAQIHGVQYMAYSRRRLVSTYLEFENGAPIVDTSIDARLMVQAAQHDDRSYIFEDAVGTHIVSETVLSAYDVFEALLQSKISAFKIDTLFNDQLDYIQAYRHLMDTYHYDNDSYKQVKESYYDLFNQPLLSPGFLMDSTVYTIEKIREREESERNKSNH